jgi:hypothetical protein
VDKIKIVLVVCQLLVMVLSMFVFDNQLAFVLIYSLLALVGCLVATAFMAIWRGSLDSLIGSVTAMLGLAYMMVIAWIFADLARLQHFQISAMLAAVLVDLVFAIALYWFLSQYSRLKIQLLTNFNLSLVFAIVAGSILHSSIPQIIVGLGYSAILYEDLRIDHDLFYNNPED